ncbi:hypothetical protein LWI28_016997 [Acer negundo]|uniref:PGG domain-containing protein n=1 Tax=Acer negundo TaxID=4023 RepID=A0AAD5JJ68_ACENE|nr:hypothetical protein LWI28_016997 [Acer negundo]
MLDALLNVEDETGRKLEDDEIIDVLLMYLNAGHESSGHIIMWATVFLQAHPHYLHKAKVIDETLRIVIFSLTVFREAKKRCQYKWVHHSKGLESSGMVQNHSLGSLNLTKSKRIQSFKMGRNLDRKPEMAGELDARKSSPLHLATAKGYLEIVKKLVSVNPEMCFARDRDGRNPLHIATIKGHISVLRELVNVRPQAARMSIADRGETILHLCVRYSQLEILKLLVETIGDNGFLNSKDDDGNTILHTAAADKQLEVMEYLIIKTAMEVNAINAYGFTALDLSTQSIRKDEKDWEIAELLRRSGAKHTKDIHLSAHELGTTQMARTLTSHENLHTNNALQPQNEGRGNVDEKKNDWVDKMGSALMVAASLIATMAFQVAVNPPGGVWQEDDPKSGGRTSTYSDAWHKAGKSIYADTLPDSYNEFLIFDTTGFLASLSIILLLISGLPIGRKFFMWILMVIMWIAISAMSFTYMFAVTALSESMSTYMAVDFALYVWIRLMVLLLLVHIILLIVKMIKYVRKLIRQRRQPSSNMA